MTTDHEATARSIVEPLIDYIAMEPMVLEIDDLASAIATALREAEERATDRAAKLAEARAYFHLAKLDVAIGEPPKFAHDIAQAELFELAAAIRSTPDE